MRLGKNQKALLDMLRERGSWDRFSHWVWSTERETEKMLARFVQLGLAHSRSRQTERGMEYTEYRPGPAVSDGERERLVDFDSRAKCEQIVDELAIAVLSERVRDRDGARYYVLLVRRGRDLHHVNVTTWGPQDVNVWRVQRLGSCRAYHRRDVERAVETYIREYEKGGYR